MASMKEGHVAVRGHFMWRERYVILETGRITILRSGKGAVKAKIDLLNPGCKVVFHEDNTQFTVSDNGSDTVFNCQSRSDRDNWVGALFMAMGNHGGDTDCENSDLVLSSMTEFEKESSSPRVAPLAQTQPLAQRVGEQEGYDDDHSNDDDRDESYNDTLRAFQDLRSSMLECNLSLTTTETTELQPSRSPSPPRRPCPTALHDEETAKKRRNLSAIVAWIQTVQHGGRTVLLHLDVIQTVCDISLEEILTAIGERQRSKASVSSGGLQRLHVATFVRHILFHPLFAKQPEIRQRAAPIDALVDRYFPHCRLRRFSHDLEQGNSAHAFELDLNGHQKESTSPRDRTQQPHHGARVAPVSLPKPELSRLNKKRHSFPNILLPLQIGPLTAQPSLRRIDSVARSSSRTLLLLQCKRSSSDYLAAPPQNDSSDPDPNNDSDLFQDDILPEPLRNVLWKHSCQQVAEQLSLFHQQQLTDMKLWAFLATPKQTARKITESFNRLVAYFVWSVLVEESAKDRAEVIEWIITIASIASAAPLCNFHLTMACVGCLGDSPLMPSRMPLTWKRVRAKCKTQLQELRTLCDHTGGFETLRKRQALESTKGSCIPFIGVIGVTLERLRLVPSVDGETGLLDLDKLDRQYVAMSAMENAMLRPYKFHEMDELQDWVNSKMRAVDEFVTPRLLQLRSQQLLAMETSQQSGSGPRHASLYRARHSPGSTGSSSGSSLTADNTGGPPLLPFRDICSILVSTKEIEERIQLCVEALLADERQSCSILLRKFLSDFKQAACHSASHVVLASVRNCVDTMRQDVLTLKSYEIMELTGLDESSIQLERGLYMALLDAVTRPIGTWLFTKIKHAFRTEDARVCSRLREWLQLERDQQLELHLNDRAKSMLPSKLPTNPVDLLSVFADALCHLPNDADEDTRAFHCVELLSSCTHPFSVLFLLQQVLDTLFLSRELRDTLELLDTALSAADKRHLKRISRASASVSCGSSGSAKSLLHIQPPEIVSGRSQIAIKDF